MKVRRWGERDGFNSPPTTASMISLHSSPSEPEYTTPILAVIPLQLFAGFGGQRLYFVHHAGCYLGFVLGFGLWAWAALDLGQPWQWNVDPGS